MDKHPPIFDKSLLIPVLIGTASLLGICLTIGLGWPRGQDSATTPTQTVTPFKYVLLATETIKPALESDISASQDSLPTSIAVLRVNQTPLPAATEQSGVSPSLAMVQVSETPLPGATEQSGVSPEDAFAPTAARPPDPIFDKTTPMATGTYDDRDSHIIRTGNWMTMSNLDFAYQGTLLISDITGNFVAFNFIGTLMVLGYQSNLEAGDVTINIDGLEYVHAQAVGFEWISPELLLGPHYVLLTHESGSSVNLDYIEILDTPN